jgi:hypothetical protein
VKTNKRQRSGVPEGRLVARLYRCPAASPQDFCRAVVDFARRRPTDGWLSEDNGLE